MKTVQYLILSFFLFIGSKLEAQWVQTSGLSDSIGVPAGLSFVDSGTRVFAGTRGGIFVSTDTGATWNATSLSWKGLGVNNGIIEVNALVRTPAEGQAYQGIWSTKSSTGFTGREFLSSCVLNNQIFALGGFNGNYLSTMEVYDPASNTWSTPIADGSMTPRELHASCAVNGKLYVFGGDNSNTQISYVEVYDPSVKKWTILTTTGTFTPRNGLTSSVVNGMIYVIGGYSGGIALNTLEVFDPVSNSWSTPTTTGTFTARAGLTSSVVNGKIYVIGGGTGNYGRPASNILEVFDPHSNTWSTPITRGTFTARTYLSSEVVNGMIYVFGGYDSTSALVSNVDIFDPSTNTWLSSQSTGNFTPRAGFASGLINGSIYAIGGASSSLWSNANEAYTPSAPISGPDWLYAATGVEQGFGVNGAVYRSIDNGANWADISSGSMSMTAVTSLCVFNKYLVAGTVHENGGGSMAKGIFRSTDMGASWSLASTGLTDSNIWAITRKDSLLFAATNSGIFRSRDSGLTWMLVGNDKNIASLLPVGENILAGSWSGALLESNDNGENWSQIGSIGPSEVACLASDGSNLFAGSSYNKGVSYSSDDGSTWNNVSSGMTLANNAGVNSLWIKDGYLLAGTGLAYYQGGVWRRPLSEMVGPSDVAVTSDEVHSLTIFPNPATSSFTVSFANPSGVPIHYEIDDVLGRILTSGETSESQLSLSAQDLPAGVLLFRASSDGFVQTRLFVVAR